MTSSSFSSESAFRILSHYYSYLSICLYFLLVRDCIIFFLTSEYRAVDVHIRFIRFDVNVVVMISSTWIRRDFLEEVAFDPKT